MRARVTPPRRGPPPVAGGRRRRGVRATVLKAWKSGFVSISGCATNAWPSGIQSWVPSSGKAKLAGITPTTVYPLPSSASTRPMAPASPPKSCIQRPWLSTTTGSWRSDRGKAAAQDRLDAEQSEERGRGQRRLHLLRLSLSGEVVAILGERGDAAQRLMQAADVENLLVRKRSSARGAAGRSCRRCSRAARAAHRADTGAA